MRSFTIFLVENQSTIQIGSNETLSFQKFQTYNEILTESEHDQYMLSFSIIAKSYEEDNVEWNPLLSSYYIGAKLRLLIDNYKRVDLIIKQITPKTNQLNTEFNIQAQDEVSYLWSKHNITQTYSTSTADGILTPKSIYTIAEELLHTNWLSQWHIATLSHDAELDQQLITLDNVQNNPYQILIDACNTVGAYLTVDYGMRTINFYRKSLQSHSGYIYHPRCNIQDYGVDYSGEELTTMLHVHGGTDSNGNNITMIPPLPSTVKYYLKKQYFTGINYPFDYNNFYNYIGYDVNTNTLKDSIFINEMARDGFSYEMFPVQKLTINYKNVKNESSSYVFNIEDDNTQMNIIFYDENTRTNYKLFSNTVGAHIKIPSKCFSVFTSPQNNSPEHVPYSNVQIKIQYDRSILIDGLEDVVQIFDIVLDYAPHTFAQAKEEYKNTIKQELLDFIAIIQKVPYWGQYLINFEPFKASMGITKWNDLYDDTKGLISFKLLNYNIQLLYYADLYNTSVLQLNTNRAHIEKVLGDVYLAAINAYNTDEEHKEQHKQDIEQAKQAIEDYIKSKYKDPIETLGISNILDIDTSATAYWRHLQQNAIKEIDNYNHKIINLSSSYSNATDIAITQEYYNNMINLLNQKSCNAIYLNPDYSPPGLYQLIIECIEQLIESPLSSNLAATYETIQQNIQNDVFKTLYQEYGQYLYENIYENTEELNSIALYNQAITYFADLNRVQSSHSLTVLDIGMLEHLFVPRLSVGSIISVYNEDTIQMQPYAPLLEKIAIAANTIKKLSLDPNNRQNDMNNAQNAYNEACGKLKTQYNNDNGTDIEIQEIMSKLYSDTILVTGITRVLREPLKDSVTVEQTSRYKSILAKLIQSI